MLKPLVAVLLLLTAACQTPGSPPLMGGARSFDRMTYLEMFQIVLAQRVLWKTEQNISQDRVEAHLEVMGEKVTVTYVGDDRSDDNILLSAWTDRQQIQILHSQYLPPPQDGRKADPIYKILQAGEEEPQGSGHLAPTANIAGFTASTYFGVSPDGDLLGHLAWGSTFSLRPKSGQPQHWVHSRVFLHAPNGAKWLVDARPEKIDFKQGRGAEGFILTSQQRQIGRWSIEFAESGKIRNTVQRQKSLNREKSIANLEWNLRGPGPSPLP